MRNLKPSRSFASDNNAGVHTKVMEAIARANDGHVIAYGDDPYTARAVKKFREHLGKDVEVFFEHHVQPRVISVSQASEMGTVYTPRELKALATFAHDNNMLLHVDGARIANAAAGLNVNLKAITRDAGVDILSFGGAKNGMMYGEAVVFFDKALAKNFKYTRKQGTHLPSKMRFISAQFEALLTNDLWRQNADHANRMAQVLARELGKIPQITITQKVEANGVFALVPKRYVPLLQKKYFFYVWNEETSEVRFMTSFDTTEDDIRDFIGLVKRVVK